MAGDVAGVGVAGAPMVKRELRIYGVMALLSLMLLPVWRGFSLPTTTPEAFPLHFYQHVLGGLDGRSCPSYPVCSLYARQAVDEYGWVLGGWLMIDRLIHEADDLHGESWIVYRGKTRLFDPLQRNSFWLNKE